MVMLNLKKQQEIRYEVYDARGNPIGCVILPRGQRILGRDQGTVLLRRPSPTTGLRVMPGPGESARTTP
jgi:hypothetical protein